MHSGKCPLGHFDMMWVDLFTLILLALGKPECFSFDTFLRYDIHAMIVVGEVLLIVS